MHCYVHNVPGRLRLKSPLFKNKTTHYDVQKAHFNQPGISNASIPPPKNKPKDQS